MNLTQVSQKLAELSQKFQQMINLAKRIEELPSQESLVPSSRIHVSNAGVAQSLQLQKIIDAVSSLDYNRILSIGTISRNGNSFTVPANAIWKISGVEATNISPFEFELLPEDAGSKRIDLLIVRLSGFEVITGTPSTNIFFAPDIPNEANSILVKEYKIEGNSIDEGSNPVIGNPFIYKNQFNNIAANADHKFYLDQKSNYLIIDPAITEIKGIYLTENNDVESYTGKLGFFTNYLATAVPMRHLNADAPIMFKFPKTNADYLIQPGETLFFAEESYAVAEWNVWKCLNERFAGTNPTLQQILTAGNTANLPIVSTLANGSAFAFSTNANISAQYIYAFMLNGRISLSSNSTDFDRSSGIIRAGKKIYYDGSSGGNTDVPTSFTGREVPDANWVNAGLALKANDADVLHKTGNLAELVTGKKTFANNIGLGVDAVDTWKMKLQGPFCWTALDNDGQASFELYTDNKRMLLLNGTALIGYSDLAATEKYNISAVNGSASFKGNLTTSGLLYLGKFTTGTAPAYQQGTTWFNTSLGKMIIGGATAWETVTSI